MPESSSGINEILENEWYMVRHSGEIPEIALNASLYFLTRAKEGPHLTLTEQQLQVLQQAAFDRFREIILRDLDHQNINTSIYRGVARSYANFKRFNAFCERQNLEGGSMQKETSRAFLRFVDKEAEVVENCERSSVINCSFSELVEFAELLQLDLTAREAQLRSLC